MASVHEFVNVTSSADTASGFDCGGDWLAGFWIERSDVEKRSPRSIARTCFISPPGVFKIRPIYHKGRRILLADAACFVITRSQRPASHPARFIVQPSAANSLPARRAR